MDKVSFRKQQLDTVEKFMQSDQAQHEINELYLQLFSDPDFQSASSIGITLSVDSEIPTFPIINKCWEDGKAVYVPKTYSDYSMTFVHYDSSSPTEVNSLGIKEPIDDTKSLNPPELLIVPGIAFSKEGKNRLGSGSGFYDRYLAQYATKTVSLALSRQFFVQAPWPVFTLDKPVDKIISVAEDK